MKNVLLYLYSNQKVFWQFSLQVRFYVLQYRNMKNEGFSVFDNDIKCSSWRTNIFCFWKSFQNANFTSFQKVKIWIFKKVITAHWNHNSCNTLTPQTTISIKFKSRCVARSQSYLNYMGSNPIRIWFLKWIFWFLFKFCLFLEIFIFMTNV